MLQPRFKAAVDRAMRNDEAMNTIGVIHVRARDGHVHVANIGTTAEVSSGDSTLPHISLWLFADGRYFKIVAE